MPNPDQYDVRQALLEALMEKVQADPYPSNTMLDMIEELLSPEDVENYVETLLDRIRSDNFPSISMIGRVQALT